MWDDPTKRNTNEIGKEKEQVLDLQKLLLSNNFK